MSAAGEAALHAFLEWDRRRCSERSLIKAYYAGGITAAETSALSSFYCRLSRRCLDALQGGNSSDSRPGSQYA
jgi:hypothetical protein